MNKFLIGTVLASTLFASTAYADTYVMNAAYGQDALTTSVVVRGFENPWTTPITMTNTAGTILTYCDDFFHTFTVGGTYNMVGTSVTTNYNGGTLTEAESN